MFFISFKCIVGSDFRPTLVEVCIKEIRKFVCFKTKHRRFDSPPRWGIVRVLVVTLEEQEVATCLNHSAPSVRPNFLTWKSPSRPKGGGGARLGGLSPIPAMPPSI